MTTEHGAPTHTQQRGHRDPGKHTRGRLNLLKTFEEKNIKKNILEVSSVKFY